MTGISLAKTAQNEKLTLSGYGFTMEISANSKPILFDAEGKEIADVQQRMDAQKALVLPLIQTLGASWLQEMVALQQASTTITDMSACPKTRCTPPADSNEPKIGQVMPNGTIYADISLTTKTKMFAMPKDSGIMTWNDANKFKQELSDQYGYNGSKREPIVYRYPKNNDGGWRLPTCSELYQILQNKEDIGGFDGPELWYWSAEERNDHSARMTHSTDRSQYYDSKGRSLHSVRFVRSEPV